MNNEIAAKELDFSVLSEKNAEHLHGGNTYTTCTVYGSSANCPTQYVAGPDLSDPNGDSVNIKCMHSPY